MGWIKKFSWAGPPQSSSSSSRLSHSRPATASSQREISHEKSILYSVLILSNNCLQKTFEILNDLGGDASEFEVPNFYKQFKKIHF